MQNDVDDFLEHYGVKGMKWGVRKARDTASTTSTQSNTTDAENKSAKRKALAKKVAIGTGLLIAAGGAAYIAHRLNQDGGLRLKDQPEATKKAKEKVVSITTEEPTSLIYSTRVKDRGFAFRQTGDLSNVLKEYDKVLGQEPDSTSLFVRYGDRDEKIAARFLDPKGRRDQANRVIPHEVIIPESMTSGISNIEDVIAKIWPTLEPAYTVEYDESAKRRL